MSLIGKFIEDKYLVMAKLGKGGGGSAYKVVDRWNNDPTPVCLKIIDNSDMSGMLEIF